MAGFEAGRGEGGNEWGGDVQVAMTQMKTNSPTKIGSELCCADLLADGWREYPDQFKKYARCFYKRFDTPTRCFGNDDKPGVQIQISVSEHDGWVSMEIDLCAGLRDNTWIAIKNYALPKTVKEVTELIPRLIAVWESANHRSVISTAQHDILA